MDEPRNSGETADRQSENTPLPSLPPLPPATGATGEPSAAEASAAEAPDDAETAAASPPLSPPPPPPPLSPLSPPPEGTLVEFLRQETAPLAVAGAALLLFFSAVALFPKPPRTAAPPSPPSPPRQQARTWKEKQTRGKAEAAKVRTGAGSELFPPGLGKMPLPARGLYFLIISGALAFAAWAVAWLVSEKVRRRTALRLVRTGSPPTLSFTDLIALLLLFLGLISWAQLLITDCGIGSAVSSAGAKALAATAQMVCYGLVLTTMVHLTRLRGAALSGGKNGAEGAGGDDVVADGGGDGAAGLWPFWRRASTAAGPPTSLKADLLLGAAFYPLFMWAVVAAGTLNLKMLDGKPQVHPLLTELAKAPPFWVKVLLVLFTVLGAPFFEELLFRGALYNVVRRSFGRWTGALVSAAVFAGVHRQSTAFLPLFVLGLLLVWLYERTGRLTAPMAFHAVFNACSLTMFLGTHG